MSSPTDTLAHHPVARACEQVTAALDALGEAVLSAWSGTDADLAEWVKATDVAVSRIAAVQAEVIAECAARDLPKRAGSTGGTAWLAGVLTARPGRAEALWRLANDLADGPRASPSRVPMTATPMLRPTPTPVALPFGLWAPSLDQTPLWRWLPV